MKIRLIASLMLAFILAGCTQIVEVRSNRGEMELVKYREIVIDIHEQLYEDGFVSGSTLEMDEDRTIFSYAAGNSVSTEELRQVVSDRYQARQREHTFEIEAVEIVSARSRGVRIDRSLAP